MAGLLFSFCFMQLNSKPVNFLLYILVCNVSFMQFYNPVDNGQTKAKTADIGSIIPSVEWGNQFFECGIDTITKVVEMNKNILMVVADSNVYLFIGRI